MELRRRPILEPKIDVMADASLLTVKSHCFGRELTGPILDVDYELELTPHPEVPSLQDFCGKTIVSDYSITRRYVAVMPSKVKAFVMRSALAEGRLPTISILLKNWPYSIFKFPQLPVLKEWLFSCSCPDWLRFSKSLRKALQCTSAVVNAFLEIVRKDSTETKLKYLDLSAVPLCEKLVLRICNFISDNCASQSNNAGAGNISSVAKYTIKLHCTLSNSNVVYALYSAVMKEEMGLSVIKLSVSGLSFRNRSLCQEGRSPDLIRMINPVDLQIVCFDFPCVLPKTLKEVLGYLDRFHNLRVLDFSYFPVFAIGSVNFFATLQSLLRELVHISRIDISNCNIKNGIQALLGQLCQSNSARADSGDLSAVHKKSKVTCSNPYCQGFPSGNLEYLNLSGCRLSQYDLECLADTPQARTLKNLNLCCNILADKLNSLLGLLQALAPSLCILEIADTYFKDDQMGELFPALSKMKNLRFVNISNPRTSSEALLRHLPELCRLPRLKMIGLSVPQSVHQEEMCDFRTQAVNLVKSQGSNIELLWQP